MLSKSTFTKASEKNSAPTFAKSTLGNDWVEVSSPKEELPEISFEGSVNIIRNYIPNQGTPIRQADEIQQPKSQEQAEKSAVSFVSMVKPKLNVPPSSERILSVSEASNTAEGTFTKRLKQEQVVNKSIPAPVLRQRAGKKVTLYTISGTGNTSGNYR